MRLIRQFALIFLFLFGLSACTTVKLEYDRMTGTAFPQSETVDGEEITIGTIYLQGNILLVEDQDDTSIAPLTGPFDPTDPDQYDYITKAELETIELANRSTPVGVREWECEFWIFDGTCREYHVYGIVVNHYREKDDGTRSTGSMSITTPV